MNCPKHTVKTFVQTVLGCGCPESVLLKIEISNLTDNFGIVTGKKAIIGERLLIHVINLADKSPGVEQITHFLGEGVRERDLRQLNRFRLVLAVDPEKNISISNCCRQVEISDEKTHLHMVDKNRIPSDLLNQ